MKKVTITLMIGLCISILMTNSAMAQSIDRSVISSGGSSMNHSGLSFDFTAGEALTTTMETGSFILTQGFQQTETLDINKIKEAGLPEVNFKIYPVPATDHIIFELISSKPAAVYLSITTANGRILFQQNAVNIYPSYEQRFPLGQLASGAYFLNICEPTGTLIKSLRFLKQ